MITCTNKQTKIELDYSFLAVNIKFLFQDSKSCIFHWVQGQSWWRKCFNLCIAHPNVFCYVFHFCTCVFDKKVMFLRVSRLPGLRVYSFSYFWIRKTPCMRKPGNEFCRVTPANNFQGLCNPAWNPLNGTTRHIIDGSPLSHPHTLSRTHPIFWWMSWSLCIGHCLCVHSERGRKKKE